MKKVRLIEKPKSTQPQISQFRVYDCSHIDSVGTAYITDDYGNFYFLSEHEYELLTPENESYFVELSNKKNKYNR